MAAEELATRHCTPCEGLTGALTEAEATALLADVPGWIVRNVRLFKSFKFQDFRAAMAFLARVADLAEAEGHHPDFCLHYRIVDFFIYTHAVGGLSENDFILAAKIDHLV